ALARPAGSGAAVEALADQGVRSRLADLGIEVHPRDQAKHFSVLRSSRLPKKGRCELIREDERIKPAARRRMARAAAWPITSTEPRRRSGRRGSVRYRGALILGAVSFAEVGGCFLRGPQGSMRVFREDVVAGLDSFVTGIARVHYLFVGERFEVFTKIRV